MKLKLFFLVIFIGVFSFELFADSQSNGFTNKAVDGGIGLGSIIAVVASWSRNKSILYGILHGFLGWIYVVYFFFTKEE